MVTGRMEDRVMREPVWGVAPDGAVKRRVRGPPHDFPPTTQGASREPLAMRAAWEAALGASNTSRVEVASRVCWVARNAGR